MDIADSGYNNSNLIFKMLSGYTTRFLVVDDFKDYMNLVNDQTKLNSSQLGPEEKIIELKLAEEKFYDPRNKIAGSFDSSGNLVTTVSGYYHDSFSHWYIYRVYQQSEKFSLNDIIKNYGLLFTTSKYLVDYAESINRYTYYNKFSLKHQIGWEKGHYIMTQKLGWAKRYHYCWEEIYMPGDTCKSVNHKFFFPPGFEVTTVPSVVNINIMLPDLRRTILSNKYGLTLEKNYLIQG